MLAVRSININVLPVGSPCKPHSICLERLGVVQESDHTALVIRVFWRCVLQTVAGPGCLIHMDIGICKSCAYCNLRIG
jgi:hypothetical protein